MSAVKAIDKQITNYLVQLNQRQKKAVLTVVKTFAEKQQQDENSHWKDPGFIAEMDKRIAELEEGKIKGRSWEGVKQSAKQSVKSRKRK